jgi:DEAD/DEAH box helicase domain-containing protein
VPDSLRFDYVDANKLLVDAEPQPSRRPDAKDIYKIDALDLPDRTTVLHFEFTDGDLKPKRTYSSGYSYPYMSLLYRNHMDSRESRLPEFTPAAMTRLINKRNQKFRRAVAAFLARCRENVLVSLAFYSPFVESGTLVIPERDFF